MFYKLFYNISISITTPKMGLWIYDKSIVDKQMYRLTKSSSFQRSIHK